MTLKNIFKKPVDRPIEGVIKADDEASLRLEIEEYVITNEVEKRLENFLEAYNNYEGANGVWISGFFGSGKSHLLKILAIILENREIDGVNTLDVFLPKCGENEILKGDLKRAVSIPSRSILFNIDQKADVISKTEIDALLSVFVKVFDEMSGYYGKQGHIAQFERNLDTRGIYQEFKDAYKNVSGRNWYVGREQALLESTNIAKAYGQVTGDNESTTIGILDKYRNEYRVSIEDFAANVNTYIDSQGKDFRLNFFVDEVGQYIAENIKLMTNLQTIAESLATKCRGRAWVIVTAQEDMKSVVGEMNKQQGNDFSKIQARFANRMKLTSADVAEVIQKRLLMKNEEGIEKLSIVYDEQSNNFKTLFDFADGSTTYRNFQDSDHFIHSYPFMPYQFALFQSAIQQLSDHNAFEGKHSSVGERSMLGVFQEVAIQIGDHKLGQLATFDLMFEGIRTALKSSIQRAVQQAEKHLGDPFAVRVLKALFLVKYVKEFKSTIRNLCVLMLDDFNQDLPTLRKSIEEALNLLEQQTYIQRNGDLYEYLTNEEKDVEEEIKNTEVESADIASELEKIVFDHVIKNRKIRYDDNGQDYTFSKKLDDKLQGREHELTIHVISPFHENNENIAILQSQSLGREELLVVMPSDERLVRDLLMYKRTEKYIRQNISVTQQDAIKKILTDKGHQNRERLAELQNRVTTLVGKSTLIVSGVDFEVGSEDAQTRVIKGFHELVSRTYPNLRMLRGVAYSENTVGSILKQAQEGLFGNDATSLSEAEQEVLAHIQSNNRGGVRTTVKTLIEKFERKPYGWSFAAVLCTIANLCARGKVETRADGNLLEDNDLERTLLNTQKHNQIVLEPQVEFTASQVRGLKEFYSDFFDAPPSGGEAKSLGKETGVAFQNLINDLNPLYAQSTQYPFLNSLKPAIDDLKGFLKKPYTWYLTELSHQEDKLLDMKEAVIDPIRKFMNGTQKKIYDDASLFVKNQEPNFGYFDKEESLKIVEILSDQNCYKGNKMQQIKSLVDDLQEKISRQVKTEIAVAIKSVDALKVRLCSMTEFTELEADQQAKITQPFPEFESSITRHTLIAVIRDTLRRFEESDYPRQLAMLTNLASPKSEPKAGTDDNSNTTAGSSSSSSGFSEPQNEFVNSRSIHVPFDKAWLANEKDIDDYITSMRKALLEEIKKGKRVQI